METPSDRFQVIRPGSARDTAWAMSEENVEVVRRSIDAFNRGDRDAWLADFAPEAEWHTTGRFADSGVYRGRAGLERYWAELQEDIEELSFSVSDIRATGDRVFVAGKGGGRGKRSKAHSEEPIWYVVALRNRRIVRVQGFASRAEALEAAGLSE
jgi:ketosteroid isomerase-like protein